MQMQVIRSARIPVLPLVEAAELLVEGRLERPSLAITFDDGFCDNVDLALPHLQRHGFPATVFLATGVSGTTHTLWPSRLLRALIETQYDRLDMDGESLALSDRASRVRASARLQELIKARAPADPAGLVAKIERHLGLPEDAPVQEGSPYAMMGKGYFQRALASGLIEFGAHTVTHPLISALDDDRLEAEIAGSIDAVERLTGRPCRSFAYPNGRLQDFDDRALTVLARRGIRAAVTTVPGPNFRDADPLRLARWGVGAPDSMLRFYTQLRGLNRVALRAYLQARSPLPAATAVPPGGSGR